jgi:hypothetical protein
VKVIVPVGEEYSDVYGSLLVPEIPKISTLVFTGITSLITPR